MIEIRLSFGAGGQGVRKCSRTCPRPHVTLFGGT
jgi:hypothetical protein